MLPVKLPKNVAAVIVFEPNARFELTVRAEPFEVVRALPAPTTTSAFNSISPVGLREISAFAVAVVKFKDAPPVTVVAALPDVAMVIAWLGSAVNFSVPESSSRTLVPFR